MPEVKQLDCREAMAQLWDFLDEELTPETMSAVKTHLDACAACHPHAQFAERFLAALGRCRPTDDMPGTLKQRIMVCLQNEGLKSAS